MIGRVGVWFEWRKRKGAKKIAIFYFATKILTVQQIGNIFQIGKMYREQKNGTPPSHQKNETQSWKLCQVHPSKDRTSQYDFFLSHTKKYDTINAGRIKNEKLHSTGGIRTQRDLGGAASCLFFLNHFLSTALEQLRNFSVSRSNIQINWLG